MSFRFQLIAAAIITATLWACARDHAAPRNPAASSLSIRVTFPSGELGDPEPRIRERGAPTDVITRTATGAALTTDAARARLVTRVEVRAVELETNEVQAEDAADLEPTDTQFRFELEVPADQDYRIEVSAFGTRETGGATTEPGLLYSGFAMAFAVNRAEPSVVDVLLENRVPFLQGEVQPTAIRLRWSEVATALGYRIRETIDGSSREFAASGRDTLLPIPPRRPAADTRHRYASLGLRPVAPVTRGGETRAYRVRAELPGQPGAFSEAVQIELMGPTAPAAVSDLVVTSVTTNSIELEWTAPGDDGDLGQASLYDLRRAGIPITEATFDFEEVIPDPPTPAPAGTRESFTVGGLDPETEYYIALRTIDEVPLASAISNIVQATTAAPPDTSPPAAPNDLAVVLAGETTLNVTWTATGDDGSIGRATSYDLRWALFSIDADNFGQATPAPGLPAPGDPGTPESVIISGLERDTFYFLALRVQDEVGNASELATTTGQTIDETPPAIVTLAAAALSETTVRLDWNAPGDDKDLGQASSYDVRYSAIPLDPEDFDQASVVPNPPLPASAGTPQFLIVDGLPSETRAYFALRSRDDSDNLSPFSNVAEASTFDLTPPSAVSDLAATASTDQSVRLEWTAPGDDGSTGQATEYELRFANFVINASNFDQAERSAIGPPAPAGGTESAEITGLQTGTSYWFALLTRDNAGNTSALSNVPTALPTDGTPPAAVADLAAFDVQTDRVSMSWTAPGDDGNVGTATVYEMRYETFPLDEGNFEDAFPVTQLPAPAAAGQPQVVTVPGLAELTTYYIGLRAQDEVGNLSPLSNIVEFTTGQSIPDSPTNLIAIEVSAEAIDLTWLDHATNETSYDIERGQDPGSDFTLVAILPGSFDGQVGHLDAGLAERTEYKYRVRARNPAGPSGYSNEAVARTGMAPPTALIAAATGPNTIDLTWTFGADPDSFLVERRTGSGAFTQVADLSGGVRSWQDGNLSAQTTYVYRVRGSDAFGASPYSNQAGATTGDLNPLCLLEPSFLDFGTVEAGFPKSLSFTIENVGGGVLTGFVDSSCDNAWSIVEGLGSYALSNGQTHLVKVQFAPPGVGSYSCSVDAGIPCGLVDCQGDGLDARGFWWSGFGPPPTGGGASSPVHAFKLFAGTLFVGGEFTRVGPLSVSNIARWTGTSWIGADGGVPGPVRTFAALGGVLYAGGDFVEPLPAQGGPLPRNHLAYWAPGVFWSGETQFPDATVHTMLDDPTELILGGDFVSAGQLLNHVAIFSDGEFFQMGNFTSPGVDGPVYATASFLNDEIIAGDFLRAGLTTVNHIVRWSDSTFVPLGAGTNGPIYAMVRNGSLLYVGGDFTTAGGISAPGIAIWDGSTWSAVDPSIDLRPVNALTQFDGDIIAGGPWVLDAPSGPLNRVAAWNGIDWQPLGHGIEDGEVLAFGALNGSLFVGGTFNLAGGLASWHIARWDPNVRREGEPVGRAGNSRGR